MSIRIPIVDIQERAKERPSGYFEDVMSQGKVDGEEIELEEAAFERLAEKYSGRVSLAGMAGNFAKATFRWVTAGAPVVTEEEFKRRAAICESCPHWHPEALVVKCDRCGCSGLKLVLATERCPIGNWEVFQKP
jgi:hypothetical protein